MNSFCSTQWFLVQLSVQQVCGKEETEELDKFSGMCQHVKNGTFSVNGHWKIFSTSLFSRSRTKSSTYRLYLSPKSCMNTTLFYSWLIIFDCYLTNPTDRNFALCIDNAWCHRRKEDVSNCKVSKLFFYRSVQLLGAGAIASLKRVYVKAEIETALNLFYPKSTIRTYTTFTYVNFRLEVHLFRRQQMQNYIESLVLWFTLWRAPN